MAKMERYIRAFRTYEIRSLENMFAHISREKEPWPNNPNTSKLWFIGLAVWGKEFASRDAEIRDMNIK